MKYLYLHGFASGAGSRKGLAMEACLAGAGVTIERLELNVPSFGEQTVSRALDVVSEAAGPEGRVRLMGSSMGGYTAALWASLHPERVDRMVLLCPGFDLVGRWPKLMGEALMKTWEETGWAPLRDGAGRVVPVHWEMIADMARYPREPVVPCPTLIIHGTEDPTVPVETSRAYAAAHPQVELVEVLDNHSLMGSLAHIGDETLHWFGLE